MARGGHRHELLPGVGERVVGFDLLEQPRQLAAEDIEPIEDRGRRDAGAPGGHRSEHRPGAAGRIVDLERICGERRAATAGDVKASTDHRARGVVAADIQRCELRPRITRRIVELDLALGHARTASAGDQNSSVKHRDRGCLAVSIAHRRDVEPGVIRLVVGEHAIGRAAECIEHAPNDHRRVVVGRDRKRRRAGPAVRVRIVHLDRARRLRSAVVSADDEDAARQDGGRDLLAGRRHRRERGPRAFLRPGLPARGEQGDE